MPSQPRARCPHQELGGEHASVSDGRRLHDGLRRCGRQRDRRRLRHLLARDALAARQRPDPDFRRRQPRLRRAGGGGPHLLLALHAEALRRTAVPRTAETAGSNF